MVTTLSSLAVLPPSFWLAVTRLGEAQVMLPATLVALVWLVVRPEGRPLVGWWLATLTAAVVLTTATKVAFIGWGLGIASLDFTGISGHAMFASAVYPVLLRVLVSARPIAWQRGAVVLGALLALVVGISRLEVHAHSFSEVAAGWLLGGAVSAAAFEMAHLPALRLPAWLPLAVLVLVAGLGSAAPPSRSHDMVTRLSLALSGRSVPYTRHQLLHPRRVPAAPELRRPDPPTLVETHWR